VQGTILPGPDRHGDGSHGDHNGGRSWRHRPVFSGNELSHDLKKVFRMGPERRMSP
jgi:hypothetical protein